MIDTDKYEPTQIDTLLHNTREHSYDEWRKLSKSISGLSDDDRLLIEYIPTLRAEVKRLREENELLRKADWEYECLWTWLAENTNLLNTIEPLMEEWKKELIE